MDETEKREIQQKARAAGFWLLEVPEELGGQGLGYLGMAVFWHEVSRTIAIPARDHTLFGPVVGPILMSLTGKQRARLSRASACGREACLFRADRARCRFRSGRSMRTRAVRQGNRYVINGTKRFITHAEKADFAQVIAYTDPKKGARGGISCLLVDMKTPGVTISARHPTMMGDAPCEIGFR